jgi:hypothetical protein
MLHAANMASSRGIGKPGVKPQRRPVTIKLTHYQELGFLGGRSLTYYPLRSHPSRKIPAGNLQDRPGNLIGSRTKSVQRSAR